MRAKDATIKAEAKPSKPARKASVAAPDVEAPLPPSSSPSPPPPPARRRPWWLKVLVLLVLGALLYMYVEETQEAEQRAKQVMEFRAGSSSLEVPYMNGEESAGGRRKPRRTRLCDEFPSVDAVAVLDASRGFLMKPLVATFAAFSYPFTRRRLTLVQTAPQPAFKRRPAELPGNVQYLWVNSSCETYRCLWRSILRDGPMINGRQCSFPGELASLVSRTSVVARVSSLLLGPAPPADRCEGATCCGGMRICSPQQFTNASLRDTVGCKLELAAAAGSGQFITSLDTDDSYAATYLAEMVLGMKAKRLEAACPAEHNNVKILTNGSAVPRLALNLDDLTRVKSCAGHSLTVARTTLKVCPMFHDFFGWEGVEAMATCHQREGVRTGRVPPSFPGLFTKTFWNMETHEMGGIVAKNESASSGQLEVQRGLVAHLRAQRLQNKAAPMRCILNPMAEHRCTTQNPCVVQR